MKNKHIYQSLSLNLLITVLLYGILVFIGIVNKKGNFDPNILVMMILGFGLLLIMAIWPSIFVILEYDRLLIKYPFKFPYKRNYIFSINDIVKVYIKDPKDGRFSLQKIEIHYNENGLLRVYSLGNNLRKSKIKELVFFLREKNIEVDTKGCILD